MNAAQYARWAKPLLGQSAAARRFLALPAAWERAAGDGHFFESAASSARGRETVKLALILEAPPAALLADAARRDAPAKSEAARALLGARDAAGAGYDAAALETALGLLARWRLRGSLMLSLDFDAAAGAPGKLSLYAYVPDETQVSVLRAAFGCAGAAERAGPRAGAALEFWALDLWPDGRRGLKFYRREPYAARAVPAGLRPLAEALAALAPIRGLTRLTRVDPARGASAPSVSAEKIYLDPIGGVELARLADLPLTPRGRRFAAELAGRAPGQRAFFLGFEDGELEVYFDARRLDPALDAELSPARRNSA